MASSLLPEMWEAVFDRVKDPQDFQSVINCSEDWDSLMSYKKTIRLFPLVFPILLLAVPELKSLRIMLNLRLVHPIWMEAVETELETDPRPYVSQIYEFLNTEDIGSFLDYADALPSSCNPFLGRYLTLTIMDNEPLLNRLLEKHGSHLKTVWLESDQFVLITPQECGMTLGLLPNVENLDLRPRFSVEDNWLDGSPFPPLPRLTKLDARWMSVDIRDEGRNIQALLSTLLVAYGATLNSLCCGAQLFRLNGITELLPNLVELSISDTLQLTQHDFETFSQTRWQLKTLRISIFPQSLAEATGAIAALNNFSSTLEILDMRFGGWDFVYNNFDPSSGPVFPCLKEVTLNMFDDFVGIQEETQARLLSLSRVCPNLEKCKLFITVHSSVDDDYVRMENNLRMVLMRMFPKMKQSECQPLFD